MSFHSQIAHATRSTLRLTGRPVTLVNQEAKTDSNGNIVRDDYNDPVWQSPTETSAEAELAYRGTPAFQKRADGLADDIDAIAILHNPKNYGDTYDEDYAGDADITTGEDAEGVKATRIKDTRQGDQFVVRHVYDAADGLLRCLCAREES